MYYPVSRLICDLWGFETMNYDYIFNCSVHFLETVVTFLSGSFGVMFFGLVVLLLIVSLFNALRS